MAIELLTRRPYYPSASGAGKVIIDDSGEDGGSPGVAYRQYIGQDLYNQTVDTFMRIDSLDTGRRVRWRVGGNAGTWRTAAGDYLETITAGNGDNVDIEFDSFAVGVIDEETLSVAIPEE
jgi:hypothetical protein